MRYPIYSAISVEPCSFAMSRNRIFKGLIRNIQFRIKFIRNNLLLKMACVVKLKLAFME